MNDSELLVKQIIETPAGYSDYKGWIGFFEKNGTLTTAAIDSTINMLFNYFSNEVSKCEIVFSLSWYSSIENLCSSFNLSKSNRMLLNNLSKKGWIKFNEKNELGLNVIKPSNHEHLIIKDLIISIMSIGDDIGHVFIVFPESELILYPHEDIGFGVISTSIDKENEKGLGFLKLASNNNDFDTYNGGRCDNNKIKA